MSYCVHSSNATESHLPNVPAILAEPQFPLYSVLLNSNQAWHIIPIPSIHCMQRNSNNNVEFLGKKMPKNKNKEEKKSWQQQITPLLFFYLKTVIVVVQAANGIGCILCIVMVTTSPRSLSHTVMLTGTHHNTTIMQTRHYSKQSTTLVHTFPLTKHTHTGTHTSSLAYAMDALSLRYLFCVLGRNCVWMITWHWCLAEWWLVKPPQYVNE